MHSAITIHNGTDFHDQRTGLRITADPEVNQAIFRSLGFFDDFPLDQLRAMQRPFRDAWQQQERDERLTAILQLISQVPFYQQITGSTLSELPILTKADLRRNFPNLLVPSVSIASEVEQDRISWARTSGSTGERLQVPVDMTLDRAPPYYDSVWRLSQQPTYRTAILTTPRCTATECHLGKATIVERTRWGTTLFLNSIHDLFAAPDALIRNFIDELWVFRPHILLVNPVYLAFFLLRAQALKLAPPAIEIVLSSYQYLSLIQRRTIERLLGAKVCNTYTATELCGSQVGIECCYGHWHVREDQVLMEVVDDQMRPTLDIGNILVSTDNRLMPLLRYKVGDLAQLTRMDCPCDLSDWQCFDFHGREEETIGQITTKQFDDVISTVPGIAFYHCQQRGDALHVDVVPLPDEHPKIEDLLSSTFSRSVSVREVRRLTAAVSEKYPMLSHAPKR